MYSVSVYSPCGHLTFFLLQYYLATYCSNTRYPAVVVGVYYLENEILCNFSITTNYTSTSMVSDVINHM